MSTFAPVAYGGRTKKAIIELAFEELTLSGFEFDLTPEEIYKALRRLNILMAEPPFDTMGYNHPLEEDGSPAEASGLADADVHAVALLLAKRLARMIGKTLVFDADANNTIARLRAKYTVIPTVDYANLTVRGAGAKGRYGTYFPPAFDEESIATDADPGDLAAITGA